MIEAADFCRTLLSAGYDYFTGVPCSFFKGVINYTQENPEMKYTIAANEGAAVGLAAGAYLAGRRPVVMIQNSGLGNMVNPLTSLNAIYHIPTLLLISGRAYQVEDEPQHEVMGACMRDLLGTIGISCQEAPQDLGAFQEVLTDMTDKMFHATGLRQKRPYSLIIKKGTISDFPLPEKKGTAYPLSRMEAIRMISEYVDDQTLVVATTGMPSRELFTVQDRSSNLYLMGSMGHAMAVGCSLATERPNFKVLVLDGDGSVIMHMGSLSTIGHYKPKNLIHIVLDNEVYETTGNQDTTSATTHFSKIAESCGFANSDLCDDASSFQEALKKAMSLPGPHLIHMKVNRTPAGKIPRITTKHSAPEISAHFKAYINERS